MSVVVPATLDGAADADVVAFTAFLNAKPRIPLLGLLMPG